jgi:hypothetical protein
VVREGEMIRIDVQGRRIDLQVNDLQERVKSWTPRERELRPGWLAIYSEVVQPIQKGAVLGRRHTKTAQAQSGHRALYDSTDGSSPSDRNEFRNVDIPSRR